MKPSVTFNTRFDFALPSFLRPGCHRHQALSSLRPDPLALLHPPSARAQVVMTIFTEELFLERERKRNREKRLINVRPGGSQDVSAVNTCHDDLS